MPATQCHLAQTPEEIAAWTALDAAETALEEALRRMPGVTPEISGCVYLLDEAQRLICAPAYMDGTFDREFAVHRSEYEGLGADDMARIASDIRAWLAEHGAGAAQGRSGQAGAS